MHTFITREKDFSLCDFHFAEPEEPDYDDEPVGGAVLVRPQASLDPRGTVQTLVLLHRTEPEFLNFYGAQESIPRNQFRQAV